MAKLNTLSERVRHARLQKGWTQRELAAQAGTTQQTINEIERGNITRPRKIKALAMALDVSPAWLQFGVEEIDKLDKEAIALALAWMDLPEPQKTAMEQAILEMSKKQSDKKS